MSRRRRNAAGLEAAKRARREAEQARRHAEQRGRLVEETLRRHDRLAAAVRASLEGGG